MANPIRGEVELVAGDAIYMLRMSINAIVEIENHFDMGIGQVSESLSDASGMRLGRLRAIVFYALREHHPGITEEEAGEVIGAAGLPATGLAVQQAIALAFPQAKASEQNPRKPRPRTGQGGTGKGS